MNRKLLPPEAYPRRINAYLEDETIVRLLDELGVPEEDRLPLLEGLQTIVDSVFDCDRRN